MTANLKGGSQGKHQLPGIVERSTPYSTVDWKETIMSDRLRDDFVVDMDERRFENASVKRITEIEALWRINAQRNTLLPREPDAGAGIWKLAA